MNGATDLWFIERQNGRYVVLDENRLTVAVCGTVTACGQRCQDAETIVREHNARARTLTVLRSLSELPDLPAIIRLEAERLISQMEGWS